MSQGHDRVGSPTEWLDGDQRVGMRSDPVPEEASFDGTESKRSTKRPPQSREPGCGFCECGKVTRTNSTPSHNEAILDHVAAELDKLIGELGETLTSLTGSLHVLKGYLDAEHVAILKNQHITCGLCRNGLTDDGRLVLVIPRLERHQSASIQIACHEAPPHSTVSKQAPAPGTDDRVTSPRHPVSTLVATTAGQRRFRQ